jgi:hypothetical protein
MNEQRTPNPEQRSSTPSSEGARARSGSFWQSPGPVAGTEYKVRHEAGEVQLCAPSARAAIEAVSQTLQCDPARLQVVAARSVVRKVR